MIEVYSRPRVTAYAKVHASDRINVGSAYDITIGHDFTAGKARDTAKKEIDQEDTDVVLMSPHVQSLAHNKDPAKQRIEKGSCECKIRTQPSTLTSALRS